MREYVRRLRTVAFPLAALSLLQACSSGLPSSEDRVAHAFESSGIIAVQPYTRSIFSSSNF